MDFVKYGHYYELLQCISYYLPLVDIRKYLILSLIISNSLYSSCVAEFKYFIPTNDPIFLSIPLLGIKSILFFLYNNTNGL